MKVSQLKLNPKNPCLIKDDKFRKLVRSIQEFPKMMSLRPIVIDDDNMVLGGNMRLRAIRELGMKEIPNDWVKKASELSDEEKRRFIVEDNLEFGLFDFDILANEWDENELVNWGVEIKGKRDNYQSEFDSINDDNCVLPIVPVYDEKNEVFIIVSDSEVNSNALRELFSMQQMKSYKNDEISKSNIIDIKDILDAVKNSYSQP